jgi:hypothetical protein
MASHTITGIQGQDLHINTDGDAWLVDQGATFSNCGIAFDAASKDNHVLINGDIDTGNFGIYEGLGASGDAIVVGKDAKISGSFAAYLRGAGTNFTNYGTMESTVDNGGGAYLGWGVQMFRNFGTITATGLGSSGIEVFGTQGLTVENHGMISSKIAGINVAFGDADIANAKGASIAGNDFGVRLGSSDSLGGWQASLVNAGTISSGDTAIEGSVVGDVVSNTGTINGKVWLRDGNDSFVNTGVVNGDIFLGTGNDHFSNKGGTWTAVGMLDSGDGSDTIDLRGGTATTGQGVTPQIWGGDGNDTYIVDKTTFDLRENSNGGTDTEQSTTSIALADHLENLTLLGHKNIDGNGNSADNVITGNAGNNILDGMGGEDLIDGGAGIDTLVFDDGGSKGIQASLLLGKVKGADDLYSLVFNIENVRGTEFVDIINGDDKANVIEGGAGGDLLNGNGGKNTVSYQHSSDGVSVDLKTHAVSGGDAEGDILLHFQNLQGSFNNDALGGDDGKNRLDGGHGNDQLTGYLGADVFIFSGHFGKDEITDFSAKDHIDFSEGPLLFKDFADMKAHVTVSGDDLVIHHGKDTLTLDHTDISDLHASQFHF